MPNPALQVYPAIDVKDGRVVRYVEGGPDTVYALDPVAVAEWFLADGAPWLHVVDLDRAFDTGRDNDNVIRRMTRLQGSRVQVGGLMRDPEQVTRALDLGAARVVVATAAAADPVTWQRILAAAQPARLAVAVDVRQGRLASREVHEPLAPAPDALVRGAADAGVGTAIHRDLQRDGAMSGLDVEGAVRLLGLGAEILVAGGVGSIQHIRAARDAGLAGVIVGRALHEGRFTFREALACLV